MSCSVLMIKIGVWRTFPSTSESLYQKKYFLSVCKCEMRGNEIVRDFIFLLHCC